MTTFEVLEQHGTAALAKHFGLLGLFLALHLIRIPFVFIERVLAGVLVRIDRAAVAQASRTPTRRVNQFFPDNFPADTAARKEAPAHV